MKKRNIILLTLAVLSLTLPGEMLGQDGKKTGKRQNGKSSKGVDRRDQADGWYLPVKGEVTFQSKPTDSVSVKVYLENDEVGTYPADKNGKFNLELDLDNVYTLYIIKPGCRSKMITVDTHLPPDLVQYPAYECFVNVGPADNSDVADDFYVDFPSAVVRYDSAMGGYYHSEAYINHINNKLQRIAQASF